MDAVQRFSHEPRSDARPLWAPGTLSSQAAPGTILLTHRAENSIIDAADSQRTYPAFSVGGRRRQATCSDVAWIGRHHLAGVNLYGGHLRIYRLRQTDGRPDRLELLHERRGLPAPEGVAVTRDGSMLAVSHSLSEEFGLSLFSLDRGSFVPGPLELLRKGIAGAAFHGVNFSPDGRHLAFTTIGGVRSVEVIRMRDRQTACRLEDFPPQLVPKTLAFSADSKFVMIVSANNASPDGHDAVLDGSLAVHRFEPESGTIEVRPAATYCAEQSALNFLDMATFLPSADAGAYRILVADQAADRIVAFRFDPDDATLSPDGVFADNLSFPHGIDVSADGRHVAISTYGDDSIHIAAGVPVGESVYALARSADDAARKRIAVVGHMGGEMLGGAERSLLDILAAIDRSKFTATCFLPECDPAYRIAAEELCDEVISFPYRWRSVVPCASADFARFVDEFQRAEVDLVHVNTVTLVAPLLAARRLNAPCILHARELIDVDHELAEILGGDPQKVLHTLKAQADFIIANSDATHRLFQMFGRSSRRYNCVDLEAFDCSNDLQPGRLRVGVLSATSTPRKGTEQFVRLAIAASSRPELDFLVIGPRTAYIEELERVARGEPGPVRIEFMDYCPNPVDALRQINVVMSVPTIPESFGRTIAEGMAMRRPVISYDAGAAPELIRHGCTGFLIPHGEIMRALDHLDALAQAPERVLEMGERGRERALQLFCPRKFAEDLNGLYDRVLGQGAALSLH